MTNHMTMMTSGDKFRFFFSLGDDLDIGLETSTSLIFFFFVYPSYISLQIFFTIPSKLGNILKKKSL